MLRSRFRQFKIWQKLLVIIGGIFVAIAGVGIIVGMIQGAMEIANPPKKETQSATGSPPPVSSPTPAAPSPAEQLAKAALGEKDYAFVELNKAYQNREAILGLLKVDPRFDSLHDDPRFADIAGRFKIAP